MHLHEQERALVGAALLDESVARLLLTELADRELTDPTARLASSALHRACEPGKKEEEEIEKYVLAEELEAFWDQVDGVDRPDADDDRSEFTSMTDLEVVLEALDCSGLLALAGGRDTVVGLTTDRPALREALAAGHAALKNMAPMSEEPLIAFASTLLADAGAT